MHAKRRDCALTCDLTSSRRVQTRSVFKLYWFSNVIPIITRQGEKVRTFQHSGSSKTVDSQSRVTKFMMWNSAAILFPSSFPSPIIIIRIMTSFLTLFTPGARTIIVYELYLETAAYFHRNFSAHIKVVEKLILEKNVIYQKDSKLNLRIRYILWNSSIWRRSGCPTGTRVTWTNSHSICLASTRAHSHRIYCGGVMYETSICNISLPHTAGCWITYPKSC